MAPNHASHKFKTIALSVGPVHAWNSEKRNERKLKEGFLEICAFCGRNTDVAVAGCRGGEGRGQFNQWTDQSVGSGHSRLAMNHPRNRADCLLMRG